MNEFFAERVKLVRQLADRADPFTKIRLLKLAEGYEERLGLRSKAMHQLKEPITYKHGLNGTIRRAGHEQGAYLRIRGHRTLTPLSELEFTPMVY
jgi:hypothetical protein